MSDINILKAPVPINIPSALERIGGDESFLFDLVNIYVEDFTDKFEKLKAALEKRNFETITDIGHNLKGSSANLSLPLLQEISYKIEMAGKERNLEKAEKNINLLKEEFQRLKDFLQNRE